MVGSFVRAVRLVVFVATFVCASVAGAEQLLFDQVPSGGGTLSYDGDGGALVGTDLVFQQITGVGTALNSGVTLSLVDGRLNFVTGPNLAEPGTIYSWSGGGSFVLTADLVEEEDGTDIIAGPDTVLLSGTFTIGPGASMIGFVVTEQIIVAGFGIDEKNSQLLDYFGIPSGGFEFAMTAISSNDLVVDADLGFSASVAEADITNTVLTPEPTGFCLLGIALAAMFGFGRGRLLRRN